MTNKRYIARIFEYKTSTQQGIIYYTSNVSHYIFGYTHQTLGEAMLVKSKWPVVLGNVFLWVVLVVLCLAGSALAQDKVKLTFSTWWLGYPTIGELTEELVRSFNEAHPNIEVEVMPIGWGEYVDKVISLSATGGGPDVMFIDMPWFAPLAIRGLLYPIDEFMARDGIMESQYAAGLGQWQAWWDRGQNYGLPHVAGTMGQIVNASMLAEHGLETPPDDWTAEMYLDYLRRLTQDTNGDGEPDVWGTASYDRMFNMVWNFGGEVLSEDGRRITLDSQKALEAARFLASPGQLPMDPKGPQEAFYMGRAAMYGSDLGAITWMLPLMEGDPRIALLPNPKGERQVNYIISHAFTINATSPHKEEAWEFVTWVAGPHGATRDIWLAHMHFPPYSFDDPEAIDIFFRLYMPDTVDRFHNFVADPRMQSRWEPAFANFGTIHGEWWQAVNTAYRGEGDIAALINERMPRWQGLLDEFWRAVEQD